MFDIVKSYNNWCEYDTYGKPIVDNGVVKNLVEDIGANPIWRTGVRVAKWKGVCLQSRHA